MTKGIGEITAALGNFLNQAKAVLPKSKVTKTFSKAMDKSPRNPITTTKTITQQPPQEPKIIVTNNPFALAGLDDDDRDKDGNIYRYEELEPTIDQPALTETPQESFQDDLFFGLGSYKPVARIHSREIAETNPLQRNEVIEVSNTVESRIEIEKKTGLKYSNESWVSFYQSIGEPIPSKYLPKVDQSANQIKETTQLKQVSKEPENKPTGLKFLLICLFEFLKALFNRCTER